MVGIDCERTDSTQDEVGMRSASMHCVFIIIQTDGTTPQRGGCAFVVDAMASIGISM
jgi:hypothetical protein